MSEQNAYDAEVRRIAEILHNKYWEYDGQEVPLFEDENTHPELWDQAHAMVAEMAKQYAEGWGDGKDYCENEGEYVRNMENQMSIRGLIPSPENEQK
jgi:hypothetical protein